MFHVLLELVEQEVCSRVAKRSIYDPRPKVGRLPRCRPRCHMALFRPNLSAM
jgi:hypothetical protein